MKTKSILHSGISAAALFVAATGFTAPQSSNEPPPPPPSPPILAALDANHDGVIDADEIAAASKVLAALDTNNDGTLSLYELLLPPLANADQNSSTPDASPGASPSATPDAWSQGVGTGHKSRTHSRSEKNEPPPQQLSMMAALRLVATLDMNQDYFVDADEIKNASQSLLKLDKNGDGKLTADELQNPPPQPPDGGQQRGQNSMSTMMPGGPPPGNMPPPPPPGGRR